MKDDSTVLNRTNIEHLRGSAGTAYDAPAVAKSTAGFGDPKRKRRSSAQPIAGAIFVPAMRRYGGLRGETFGSAGFLFLRFANPVQSAPKLFGDSRGGSLKERGTCPMTYPTQSASARPQIPSQQIATALIGSQLIAYRINRRPDQLSYLLGLARMASALYAIDTDEHERFLADLDSLLSEEVSHG
ncbi:hypothetical protein LG302_14720 [Halomonas organivorans]